MNKSVIDRFDNSYGAHGFNSINYQLAYSIVKDCFELLFGEDKKSPSTHNIVKALKDKTVYEYFKNSFANRFKANWPDNIDVPDYIKKRESEQKIVERLHLFDITYNKFVTLYENMMQSHLYTKAKNVRNKIVSHFEVKLVDDIHKQTTIDLFGLKWNDIDDLVKTAEPIVFDGHSLITGESYDLDGLWEHEERIAKDFWKR